MNSDRDIIKCRFDAFNKGQKRITSDLYKLCPQGSIRLVLWYHYTTYKNNYIEMKQIHNKNLKILAKCRIFIFRSTYYKYSSVRGQMLFETFL